MATFVPVAEATFKWEESGGAPGPFDDTPTHEVIQEPTHSVPPSSGSPQLQTPPGDSTCRSSPGPPDGDMAIRWAEMNERMESLAKDINSLRGDVRSIRVTNQKSLASLEEKLREECMEALGTESAGRAADSEHLRQAVARIADQTSDAMVQKVAEKESELRAADKEQFEQQFQELHVCLQQNAEQVLHLTEALEKQAGKLTDLREESLSPSRPSGQASCDLGTLSSDSLSELRSELGLAREDRDKEMTTMDHRVNELKLCLEAEVGARCAIAERLSKEVQELKADRSSGSKAPKESVQDAELEVRLQKLESGQDAELQARFQKLEEIEEKMQKIFERQGQLQGASTLEMDVLSEGLKKLEAQAKKHVAWVEAAAEKNAARQEALETSIMQEAKSRTALDEELRQYLVAELSTQAKFFQGELKGLLVSAHSSFQDEIRKLWSALGQQGQESAAEASTASQESARPKRRFQVGDHVECKAGKDRWVAGEVTKLDHREADWRPDRPSVPYQLKLDSGDFVSVPHDTMETIRLKEPAKGTHSPGVPVPSTPSHPPMAGGIAAARQQSNSYSVEPGASVSAPAEALPKASPGGSFKILNPQSAPSRPQPPGGSLMAAWNSAAAGPSRTASPRVPHPGATARPSAPHPPGAPNAYAQSLEVPAAPARQSNTPTPGRGLEAGQAPSRQSNTPMQGRGSAPVTTGSFVGVSANDPTGLPSRGPSFHTASGLSLPTGVVGGLVRPNGVPAGASSVEAMNPLLFKAPSRSSTGGLPQSSEARGNSPSEAGKQAGGPGWPEGLGVRSL